MDFEIISINDLDQIRSLQPIDWPDIIPDFSFYLKSEYCYPYKAVLNGKLIATGVSIIFEKTAWLAHIIVHPDFRKQGIGLHMVNFLLENLRQKSITSCSLIATELGRPVYHKAGFREVTEYTLLRRDQNWNIPIFSECIASYKEKYRMQIYNLDRSISGENRENMLQDLISGSLLYLQNDTVLGYYLPDFKEGLIFAQTPEAGIELMKLKYSKSDTAVLPSENVTGINFLKQNGFTENYKTIIRMVNGNDISWKPHCYYSRIGGNFG
ncbi:MAG: GNAT family N-acetyltransferase [Bacteroidales bacterium]|nr:GNAT family N-acetyltransferase [Bacteroidales bacterium]